MRVNRSPSGSFRAIVAPSSPARLDQARDQAFRSEIAQRDAAHLELAVERTRTARHLAAIADARARRVARHLGELEGSRETVLHRQLLVARDRFQARAPARELLGE